jgi:hypothetical protein
VLDRGAHSGARQFPGKFPHNETYVSILRYVILKAGRGERERESEREGEERQRIFIYKMYIRCI